MLVYILCTYATKKAAGPEWDWRLWYNQGDDESCRGGCVVSNNHQDVVRIKFSQEFSASASDGRRFAMVAYRRERWIEDTSGSGCWINEIGEIETACGHRVEWIAWGRYLVYLDTGEVVPVESSDLDVI